MEIIPRKIRKLWSAEEIRILVLLSLLLQIVLIFFSLFRKRKASKVLSFSLWSSYLGADYIATLALGNLLNKQTEESDVNSNGDIVAFWAPFLLLHLGGPDTITSYSLEDNELWLRHLLGLVLEVSVAILVFLESLPSPHLWKVAIVVFAAGILKYAERTLALRSASMDQLRESMLAQPDPGPNYVKFMQEFHSRVSAGLTADITIEREPPPTLPMDKIKHLPEVQVIHWAHRFFQTFKRLTVDLMLSFQDRIESQNFFVKLSAHQAFQVVEVELSFLHDILHTKADHVHSPSGRAIRVLSLALAILALMLFHYSGKHDFKEADVMITYVLLVAALGLETIAIFLLAFSDWTIVALLKSDKLEGRWITRIKEVLKVEIFADVIIRIRSLLLCNDRRRWSNSMKQYSLIRICLFGDESNKLTKIVGWILGILRLKEPLERWWHAEDNDVGDDQKKLIFDELKAKISSAEGDSKSYKRLQACRGEWVLREKGYTELNWSVSREFDESILLWHIATYLCYQDDTTKAASKKTDDLHQKIKEKDDHTTESKENSSSAKEDRENERKNGWLRGLCRTKKTRNNDEEANRGEKVSSKNQEVEDPESKMVIDHREISKKISDYMMYLVVFQPSMLPPGIGKIRFQDTCAEAKKFFSDKARDIERKLNEKMMDRNRGGNGDKGPGGGITIQRIKNLFIYVGLLKKLFCSAELLKKLFNYGPFKKLFDNAADMKKMIRTTECVASEKLLDVRATFDPKEVKGDRSKSVLFDACRLTKHINELELDKTSEKKWKVISAVWVEILCYAAGNCNAYAHAKQLSQGGELLTHVWLLMTHMGIGEQYRIESGHARAKLIVET